MSTEIDRRVVEMQFDNKDFERNVQQSLSTLDKLKMALNFDGAKGLDSITKAADKVDMSNITTQTQKVQISFSALQVAGYTMVSELTKSFMNFGKNLWNISFGQMKSGGMARSLKIEQANFKMEALAKNIDAVKNGTITATQLIEKMGDAIDKSVTGTAYGYDAAANIASQLMASGMTDSDKMYSYLRGIAGAAAMTGRSFEDIGNIFSTVASNGKLMTMQLRQFSASGLNVSATLAQQLGKTENQINEMVTKGQIGFEEFATAMYDAFGESAGKADETYAGVLSNVKAQLSRLGQRFAQPYIKNMIPFLQQLKASIKGISSVLAPVAERWDFIFGRFTTWGANVLKNINVEKFTYIFRGIENLLFGVAGALHVVHDAFVAVFPKKTADQIINAAKSFEAFTEQVLPSKEALEGLKGIFITLFTPLRIILNLFTTLSKYIRPVVVSLLRVAYAFMSIFQVLGPLALEFLDFVNRLGIFEAVLNVITKTIIYLVAAFEVLILVMAEVIKQIVNSERFKNFLGTLKEIGLTIATYIVTALVYLMDVIDGVINKFKNLDGGASFFERLAYNITVLWGLVIQLTQAFIMWFSSYDSIKGIRAIVKIVENFGGIIKDLFTGNDVSGHAEAIRKAFNDLGAAAKEMGTKFKAAWKEIDKGQVIMFAFAAVIIAVMLALKGLIENVSTFVTKMTDIPAILKDLRTAIQNIGNFSGPAQAILAFTAAVAVVTNSLLLLSRIEDQNKLRNAAIAIGTLSVVILGFVAAMQVLSKKVKPGEMVIDKSAIDILAITGSIMMLVLAVRMLATLETDAKRIAISVIAIISMMASIIGAVWLIGKIIPELKVSAAMFMSFSISMIALAKAVQILNNVPIEHLTETMAAFGTMLIAFGLAIGVAGKASGWASLSILTFTSSLVVLFGLFMLLTVIPMEMIKDAVGKATEIFNAFIPLIFMIGVSSRIAGGVGAKLGGNLASVILSLTVFLGAFIGFAYFCASYDISEAMGWLTLFLIEMGVFVTVLIGVEGYVAKAATNSRNTLRNAMNASATFTSLAKVLGALALSIVAIGIAAKLMDMVSPDSLKYLAIYIGLIAGTLIALELITSKNTKPPGKSLFNIVALLSGLGLIIAALIALQFADEVKLVIAATGISICMLALAMVIASISAIPTGTIKQVQKTVLMFIPLLVAIGALVAALVVSMVYAKDVPESTMKTFALSIGGLVGVMAIIVAKLSGIPSANYNNVFKGIGSLALLTPLLISLAYVMIQFSKAPANQLKKVGLSMGILGIAIAALAGLVVLIAKHVSRNQVDKMWGISVALTTLCLSFVEIAVAMQIMYNAVKDANPDQLTAMIGSLAGLFLEMSVLFGILIGITSFAKVKWSDMIAIAGSITLMGLAFIELASAFNIMKSSGASTDEIKGYAIAFGILIAVMAGVGAILGFFKPAAIGFIALSVALLAIGTTVKSVGQGMLYLAEAIKLLGNVSTEEIDNVIDATKRFLDRFKEIADSFKKAWPEMAETIAIVMQGLAVLIGTFVGQVVAMSITMFSVAIAQNITAILNAVSIILIAVLDWLEQPETKALITRVFGDLAEAAILGLSALLNIFPQWKELMEEISSLGGLDEWVQNLNKMNTGTEQGYIDQINYIKGLIAEEWAKDPSERDINAINTYMDKLHEVMGNYTDFFTEQATGPFGDDTFARPIAESLLPKKVLDDLNIEDEELRKVIQDSLDLSKTAEEVSYSISDIQEEVAKVSEATREYTQEEIDSAELWFANLQETQRKIVKFQQSSDPSRYFTGSVSTSAIAGNTLKIAGETLNVVREGSQAINTAAGVVQSLGNVLDILNNTLNLNKETVIVSTNDWRDYSKQMGNATDEIHGGAQAVQELQGIAKLPINPSINRAAFDELHERITAASGGLKGMVKLQSDVQPVKDNLDDNEESLDNNENQMELTGKAANEFGIDLQNLGNKIWNVVEANDILSGSFAKVRSNMSGLLTDTNVLGSGFGDAFKSAADWEKEGMQVVGYGSDRSGYMKPIYAWEEAVDEAGEHYKSLEDYVNRNSKVGYSWFATMFGIDPDKIKEEAEETANQLFNTSDAIDAVGESADDAVDNTDKLKESISSTLDVFTAFNKEANITSREVLKNLYSQIEGVSKWSEELQALSSKGLNRNFIQELAEEGPKAYDKIHAFYQMTESELALFNKMYAQELVMKDSTALDIRKSWLDAGIIEQDEYDKFATDIGAKYDEAVLKAQAEAANKKNSQMSATTKKNLESMYSEIEKYQADSEFINKWLDNNAEIGERGAEALTETMEQKTHEGIIGTAAYVEAGKEMVEDISDGIEEASTSVVNGMISLGTASLEALKGSLKMEEALTPINEFRKGVYQQVQSSLKLFDEVKVKTEEEQKEEQISTTQMLYNMAENTKKIGKWANNLKKLAARGMSEGLLESLRELGPEAADKIDAFVRMSDAELKKANNLYASSADISGYVADKLTSTYAEHGFAMALGLKEGVNEGKDDILAEMYKIGTESSEGFKNGIDPDAAKEAMELLGSKSLAAICEMLEINSPSRKMYQIGLWTVDGFVLGIGAGFKSVTKKASELASKTIRSFNDFMPSTKFKSIGENVIKGITMGIDNSINLVGKSVSTVANKIMKGLTKPLGIESPSKFAAYCAEMLNLGFANEMDDNSMMIDSANDKAEEIKNAMAEQLLNIGESLSTDDVYEPVIRPVWDMTDVENGYNSITDILGRTPLNINGTLNAASNANKTGPSQDAIMITNAINNLAADQKAIRSEINSLRTDTVNLGNRIDGMYVRLDGSALVGQIVNPMDTAMGAKSIKNARRRV